MPKIGYVIISFRCIDIITYPFTDCNKQSVQKNLKIIAEESAERRRLCLKLTVSETDAMMFFALF